MDKTDPPTSFGVFKPIGHTVIAFRSVTDLRAAQATLLEQGFTPSAFVSYTPQEMVAQVDAELPQASPMASVGQELNLVKAHRALAQRGCSFLVVHAADETQAQRVATVARGMKAVTAQRYGRFIIEELIDLPDGDVQVFESPDRGLDTDAPAEKQT